MQIVQTQVSDNPEIKYYCGQTLVVNFQSTKDAVKAYKLYRGFTGHRNVKTLELLFCHFFPEATNQEMADLVNQKISNFFKEINKITKKYSAYKIEIEHFEDESYKKL